MVMEKYEKTRKKDTALLKMTDSGRVQGLPETPPRVRADSIQINSNQAQLNSIQFKSSSNWKWLFELAWKSNNCSEMAA